MTTNGYPGDQPPGTQWTTSAPGFLSVKDASLLSLMDTWKGQSGSSVWRTSDNYVVGVLSHALIVNGIPVWNAFTRVRPSVLLSLADACEYWNCTFSYYIEPATPTPYPAPYRLYLPVVLKSAS